MLISPVQQSYSVIHICVCMYIHSFHVLFYYGLPHNIEYSSLRCTVGPHHSSILYRIVCIFFFSVWTFSSIYSGQSVNMADGQSLPFKSEILSHEKCIIRGSIIWVYFKRKWNSEVTNSIVSFWKMEEKMEEKRREGKSTFKLIRKQKLLFPENIVIWS